MFPPLPPPTPTPCPCYFLGLEALPGRSVPGHGDSQGVAGASSPHQGSGEDRWEVTADLHLLSGLLSALDTVCGLAGVGCP